MGLPVELAKEISDIKNLAKERLAAMEARLDEQELKAQRAKFMGAIVPTDTARPKSVAYGEFISYLRGKLHPSQIKALSEGTDTAGGYLVPPEFGAEVIRALTSAGAMRKIARVIEITRESIPFPSVTQGVTVTWADENTALPETTPATGQIVFQPRKLGAITRASNELLADEGVNLPELLAALFGEAIAAVEDAAYFAGDGVGKPTGLLNGTTVTRVETTAVDAVSAADIRRLFYAVPTQYRAGATWVMSSGIEELLVGLEDTTGRSLWVPSLAEGRPQTLLGRPVVNAEVMPAQITAGADVVAFGDFRYYWIAQRQGFEVQRSTERYFAEDQTAFRVIARVDGKVVLPEAFRILRVKAV